MCIMYKFHLCSCDILCKMCLFSFADANIKAEQIQRAGCWDEEGTELWPAEGTERKAHGTSLWLANTQLSKCYQMRTIGFFLQLVTQCFISFFSFPFASQEHRQTYGNTREPLLENITSDYDLELFRKAQARASEDLVGGCFYMSACIPSTFITAF